jgi:ADP-heptose:LPS heptosyltransferase
VSLQHGDPTSELADVRAHAKVDIHPGLSGYVDLDDLAALTKACDAVVTVCSTQAHLTGALGVPGLVLVPVASNWRYGREGTVSPWYASLTFARQIDADDWSVPLSDARAWLGTLRTPT